MKLKRKWTVFLTALLAVCAVTLIAACTPTDVLDGKYVVQFKFNGGSLKLDTTSVDDSSSFGFAYEEKGVLILDPVVKYSTAGTTDAISKNNFNFTGWYKDENCTQKWDFSQDRLNDDKLILYAGWESQITYTYSVCYVDGSGKTVTLGSYETDAGEKIQRRRCENYANRRSGYTAIGLFSDEECKTPWDDNFTHPGSERENVNIYVGYIEGTWTLVSTFDQLTSVGNTGNIYLTADIDCKGEELRIGDSVGNFGFTLQGNGHKISNFTVNADRLRVSLFRNLSDNAKIENVEFTDAKYVITESSSDDLHMAVLAQSATAGTIINKVSVSGTVLNAKTGLNLDALIGENAVAVYESGAKITDFTSSLTEQE